MYAGVFVIQTYEISMGRPIAGGSSDSDPGRVWWSNYHGYTNSHYGANPGPDSHTHASRITHASSHCQGEDG